MVRLVLRISVTGSLGMDEALPFPCTDKFVDALKSLVD
jgi:hypothetical protein